MLIVENVECVCRLEVVWHDVSDVLFIWLFIELCFLRLKKGLVFLWDCSLMNVLHCINVYSHSATPHMCGKMAVKMNNPCLVVPFEISVYVICMFDIHVPCSKFTLSELLHNNIKRQLFTNMTLLHVWVYKWPSSGYRLTEVRQWNICKCPTVQINIQLFSLMGQSKSTHSSFLWWASPCQHTALFFDGLLPEDGRCRLKRIAGVTYL
jgi:hypothetical protein